MWITRGQITKIDTIKEELFVKRREEETYRSLVLLEVKETQMRGMLCGHSGPCLGPNVMGLRSGPTARAGPSRRNGLDGWLLMKLTLLVVVAARSLSN